MMWAAATQRLRALWTFADAVIRDRCCCSYDNQWTREDAVEQRCDIIGGCCKFDGVVVDAVG